MFEEQPGSQCGGRGVVDEVKEVMGLVCKWQEGSCPLIVIDIPSPGDLPNPGIEPRSPTLQVDSLPTEPQGKPH